MTGSAQTTRVNSVDYDRTLILAVELGSRSWVVAVQIPGGLQKATKQQIAPQASALMAAIKGYQRRADVNGMAVDRVIVTYESGGGPLGVSQNKAFHPELESHQTPIENPKSQQTLAEPLRRRPHAPPRSRSA